MLKSFFKIFVNFVVNIKCKCINFVKNEKIKFLVFCMFEMFEVYFLFLYVMLYVKDSLILKF